MNRFFSFRLAVLSLLISILTLASSFEKVIAAEAGGGATVSGVGAWGLSIDLTGIVGGGYPTMMANWTSSGGATDYLSFVDTGTGVYGAHLKVHLNSGIFAYTGNGAGNTGLVKATNLYFMAKNNTSPDKARNDTTKTANLITAESCGGAQTTDIVFNSQFNSGSLSNSLRIGTNDKILFQISTACTTTTKLNFSKVRIFYPNLATGGSYGNTITLTAVDGLP